MKITLSKIQWQEMGKKAGWVKQAQSTEEIEAMEPISDLEEQEALKQETKDFANRTRNFKRRIKNAKNPFARYNKVTGKLLPLSEQTPTYFFMNG